MSSSIIKRPRKATQASPARPKPARPNPARQINDREWRRKQQAAAAASASSSTAGSPPPNQVLVTTRMVCVNKECINPNVIDGTCNSCGYVAEEKSDIVNELGFSEAANGAAQAVGTFMGAGEAGPRLNGGANYRRVGGGDSSDNKAKSQREANALIKGMVSRFELPNSVYEEATRAYRLASNWGFVRGRGMNKVATVCLYFGCRRIQDSTIMLIDLADVTKEDVFDLGRTFKRMVDVIALADKNRPELYSVFPEDLIRRFATKLEFDKDTHRVATAAVRIVQRMDRDWMVMGRKPAGICGCALIIAARMYNYRRTPLEVAYVAKVTMYTLQLRLNEFAVVKSADMVIDDFFKGDLDPSQHDPPSFYRATAQYQEEQKKKQKPRKKRKRPVNDNGEDARLEEAEQGQDANGTSAPIALVSSTPVTQPGQGGISAPIASPSSSSAPQPPQGRDGSDTLVASGTNASGSAAQSVQLRNDTDGYAIPAIPPPSSSSAESVNKNLPITEDDISEAVPDDGVDEEDALASKYGDAPAPDVGLGVPSTSAKARRQYMGSSLREPAEFANDTWRADEEALAGEIADKLYDITSKEHTKAYDAAAERVMIMMQQEEGRSISALPAKYQDKEVLNAPVVEEDEFADDPEVQNCELSPEERKIKEQLWLNENKDWLRLQQEKAYKLATEPPKKTRRKANKKPRIGEGQTAPARSASEAAEETMKRRAMSSRLNYTAMGSLLKTLGKKGPGSTVGSEMTSRAGSADFEVQDYDSDVEDDAVNETTQVGTDDDDEGDEDMGDGDDMGNGDEGEALDYEEEVFDGGDE